MTQFDNTNRGALFKNGRREKDTHPEYRGSINVGGEDYWLSAWVKTAKDGQRYFSLTVQAKNTKTVPQVQRYPTSIPAPQTRTVDDFDDAVPF